MKITVDKSKCQGHIRCHSLAPEAFDIDDEGYPVVTAGADEAPLATLRDAEAACPEQAITLTP
ncbi:ferredoxin [Mycobacterium sp. 236(2023)]|uniref:ferredoxin n=1 Tax=Mycobacterium sp. 236(2023) TaxID=3038163 RepID=UPI0024151160|nr:ferredoxin [Mycobacterium sp. 236(2023)]MDG4668094.1 ferredoxin [Mycobacterium sp. 236(2023)]